MRKREWEVYALKTRKALEFVRSLLARGDADCLAKSLTMTDLLRSHNVGAKICIGIQKFPFEAHAWVESNDTVVSTSDKERLKKFVIIAKL